MKTKFLLRRKILVGVILVFLIILFLCIRPSVWLSDQKLFETIFSVPYPSATAIGPVEVYRGGYDLGTEDYVIFNYHLCAADFKAFTEKSEIGYDDWKPFETDLSVGELYLHDMPSAVWMVSEHGRSHRYIVADRKTFQIFAVYFRT